MLADADLLELWDRCLGRPPAAQAVALLAAAEPDADPTVLSAGQRDAALLRLQARYFGGQLEAVADCRTCGELLEVVVDAAELAVVGRSAPAEDLAIRVGEYEVRFRTPTAADLAMLPSDGAELLATCVTLARRVVDGASVEAAELPRAVRAAIEEMMAAADPGAELELALSCPACGHAWTEVLDPVQFLWAAINARAHWVAGEVHTLAEAYGWSEPAILAQSPARRRLYLEVLGG